MYVPQGHTPPCLFHLLPPIFCTDLCTAVELKREEIDLPHLILHNSQRAGCSPGRWDMLIPNSFGPESSSPTSQESALCTRQHICSQSGAVRVSQAGSAACCGQCANPSLFPPSPITAQHRVGSCSLQEKPRPSRKSDKLNSRRAD